jgi:hypothetical protein
LYLSSDLPFAAGPVTQQFSLATMAGASYIAFLTVADVPSPITNGSVGVTDSDTIENGALFFLFTDATAQPGAAWQNFGRYDMAFTAQFGGQVAAVPEPASWAVLIAGFGVVGAAARRRRAATAARSR